MANFIIIINSHPVLVAVISGVLPSLLWLWFWREQDDECSSPEPIGIIALSFVAGMAIVYAVLPLERLALTFIPTLVPIVRDIVVRLGINPFTGETIQIAIWAMIEEIAKYATVFFIAFHARRHAVGPVDAVLYLITAALGFAAMENTLYLLRGLSETGGLLQVIIDGNLRFLGATVVHTVCSGVVGITIAFSFYNHRIVRGIAVTIGLVIATLLHTYFNLTIMNAHGTISALEMFFPFWIAIIGILVLVRIIKQINHNRKTPRTL